MIASITTVAVQVNSDNSLFVTIGVDYNKDGVVVGYEITSQYTLDPGDSLVDEPEKVIRIANAVWTAEVIETHKLIKQAIEAAKASKAA
jgi:hypothetical protein